MESPAQEGVVHELIFLNVMAALVLTWAWHRYESGPTCVACSGRMRHRSDCPNRRDGDA